MTGSLFLAGNWEREFTPAMAQADRERLYNRWKKAVTRSLDWGRAVVETPAA